MFRKFFLMLDSTDANGGTDPANPPAGETPGPADWDAYVATLPEDQRSMVTKLYAEKNQALLNTVKETRKERDDLSRDLREAAKKMAEGSDAQTKLTETANALDEANKRADFFEEAPTHMCKNPKVAYAVAKSSNLFTRTGDPDWKAIQAVAPELFGAAAAPKGKGKAGEGTDQTPPAETINDFIRKRAGIS